MQQRECGNVYGYEDEDDQNGAHHSSGTRNENVLPREAVVNEDDYPKMNADVDHHQSANGIQRQGWAMKLNDYANGHGHDRVHHDHDYVHRARVHANDPV